MDKMVLIGNSKDMKEDFHAVEEVFLNASS